MNNMFQGIVTLMGRIMLTAIFLMSAVGNKIPNFSATVEKMSSEGVPLPQISLIGAIVFLIAGSLSVIVGYKSRIGALLLLIFIILATYFFHDFWTFEEAAKQQQMIQFMKNTGLAGALLIIIANGAGPMSVDGKAKRNKVASS